MNTLPELISSELKAAIFNSDEDAIKRFGLLIGEKISKIEELESEQESTKSDIRLLIETVKQGFDNVDKRFESIDKRFESIDKRFESIDKRFEDLQRYMEKRFEQVDKRFEDMNRKFDMMFKFMSLGFSIITILIVIFKFVQ